MFFSKILLIKLNWFDQKEGLQQICCLFICNSESMLHLGCFLLHPALIPWLITENSGSHIRGQRNTGWTLTLVLQPVCATISLLLVVHGNRTLKKTSRNSNDYIISFYNIFLLLVRDKRSNFWCQNKRTPWIVAI